MRQALVLLAFVLALAAPAPGFAANADNSALANSKVRLAEVNGDGGYRIPATAIYNDTRTKMMQRKVLEEFAKFLSPVRLPKTLWLYADECGGGPGATPYYSNGQRALVMCYQFVKIIEDQAAIVVQAQAKNPKVIPIPLTRDEFIAGVFAGVILHEGGHALFDILDVPIFGRQEDAADEMSTFVALQFQKQVANLVVASYAAMAEIFSDPPTKNPDPKDPNYPKDKTDQCFLDPFCAFSDEHGAWSQRFFNTLCLAYGSDPTAYADLQTKGWVPRERDCVAEYERVKQAFATTVYPFIDQNLMKQVQARQWFRPAEMQ